MFTENDYWLSRTTKGNGKALYHVVNGSRGTAVWSSGSSGSSQITLVFDGDSLREGGSGDLVYTFPDGIPTGRVGVYSNMEGVEFDYFNVYPKHPFPAAGDRWTGLSHDERWGESDIHGIDPDDDEVEFEGYYYGQELHPFFLRGQGDHPANWQLTFAARGSSGGGFGRYLYLIWDATDPYDGYQMELRMTGSAGVNAYVEIFERKGGQQYGPALGKDGDVGSSANAGTYTNGETCYFRVQYDGTNIKVYMQKTTAEPSEGSWGSSNLTWTSGTDHPSFAGGKLGFASRSNVWLDDVTLRYDLNGDGDFTDTDVDGDDETDPQLVERFTADDDGFVPQPLDHDALDHDAAGNLIFDGVHAYEYDAWNRLTTVRNAYKDSGDSVGGLGSDGSNGVTHGSLQTGAVVAVMRYDGLGRRVSKQRKNAGPRNHTTHFYYDGWSVVEERNASEEATRQNVWGLQYVDELVHTRVNHAPTLDAEMDPDDGDHDVSSYWALHDAQYNVCALIDAAGAIAERYEYTPYGERRAFTSGGTDDPLALLPLYWSQLVEDGSENKLEFSLNPYGHQGLRHDEDLGGSGGLIENRARVRHPRLQRFMQRDPLGYVDGMSVYVLMAADPIGSIDPRGLARIPYKYTLVAIRSASDRNPRKDWRPPQDYTYEEGEIGPRMRRLQRIMIERVEETLWSVGVTAWWVGSPSHEWSNGPDSYTLFWQLPQVWGQHDLYDVNWQSERNALATLNTQWADDLIVSVPGGFGKKGKINEDFWGLHTTRSDLILTGAKLREEPDHIYAAVIVHEILHSILGETIRPNEPTRDGRIHDHEGVMAAGNDPDWDPSYFGQCTIDALKRKGVSDAEIDDAWVLD